MQIDGLGFHKCAESRVFKLTNMEDLLPNRK